MHSNNNFQKLKAPCHIATFYFKENINAETNTFFFSLKEK